MSKTANPLLESSSQEETQITKEEPDTSSVPFVTASLAREAGSPNSATGKTLSIPAGKILVRSLPNREASAFEGEAFELLKESIHATGGNRIPIGVVKLPESVDGFAFELAFGERRWRACGELGLPVNAVVQDPNPSVPTLEQKLAENALRVDLSPYELGCQINTPGPDGKLCSLGRLAVLLGREKGDLSKVRRLAQLPDEVLVAFRDRTQLKFRHAKPLHDAVTLNRQAVADAAKRIANLAEALPTDDVVLALVAASKGGLDRPTPPSKSIDIEVDGQVLGRSTIGKNGAVSIDLLLSLNDRQREALLKTVQSFLRKRVLKTKPTSPRAPEGVK